MLAGVRSSIGFVSRRTRVLSGSISVLSLVVACGLPVADARAEDITTDRSDLSVNHTGTNGANATASADGLPGGGSPSILYRNLGTIGTTSLSGTRVKLLTTGGKGGEAYVRSGFWSPDIQSGAAGGAGGSLTFIQQGIVTAKAED